MQLISTTMHIFIYSYMFLFFCLGVLHNMQIVSQIAEAQCEAGFEYDVDITFVVIRLTH